MAGSLYPRLQHLRLSHSSKVTFDSCPRKLEFRKFYNLARVNEASLAGNAGSAMHEGWYEWLRTNDADAALWRMMQHYPIEFQKSPMDQRSLECCFITLQEMMAFEGFAHTNIAKIAVPQADGTSEERYAIEVPFEIFFANFSLDGRFNEDGSPCVPVSWIGYIDAILYDFFANKFIPIDVKTTTKNLSDYVPMFANDAQMLPYALVLETVTGQHFDEVEITYLLAYIDALMPKVRPLTFKRSHADVTEWAQEAALMLRQLQMFYTAGWFPRHGQSCVNWGICPYYQYCETRDHDYLNAYFGTNEMFEEAQKDDSFQPWFTMSLELEGL